MSINNSIGNVVGYKPSQADVVIQLGDGKSNIDVSAKTAWINVGNGDQDISVNVSDWASIDTGDLFGNDKISVKAGGDLQISSAAGSDKIDAVVGGAFSIDVGGICPCIPDNDIVNVFQTGETDKQSYVNLGVGSDSANIVADKFLLEKGEGKLDLATYGDDVTIISAAKDNTWNFWGNDNAIYAGVLNEDGSITKTDGNFDIKTFDKLWMEDPNTCTGAIWSKDAASFIKDTKLDNGKTVAFENLMEENIKTWESVDTQVVDHRVDLVDSETTASVQIDGYTGIEDLIKMYNLSAEQAAVLRKIDLTATLPDGSPKYALCEIRRYGGSTNFGYFVMENTSKGKGKIIDPGSKKSALGSYWNSTYNTTVKGGSSTGTSSAQTGVKTVGGGQATKTTTYTTIDTYKDSTTTHSGLYKNYEIDGISGFKAVLGDGELTAKLTAKDGLVSICAGDRPFNPCDPCGKQQIEITGGYTTQELLKDLGCKTTSFLFNTKSVAQKVEKIDVQALTFGVGSYTWASPLVLDMNGDGKVSAKSGIGVDVDGDGKVDGAASDGDKMLAMTDFTGNGKVDGAEVFGSETVSPFTGQKLNATNGFEALKMIALEAEERGYECINNGKVDLKALADALQKEKGIKLGFISDNNVTNVEDLTGARYIDANNYKEVDETGDVQHRQQGTFIDDNGNERKVDDVWFK